MSARPSDDELEALLGYQFLSKHLLRAALTHPSFGDGQRAPEVETNARLEFLGDAVLGLVVAELLYQRTPLMSEGALTEGRISFVKNERVADLAEHLKLEPWLYLGGTELNDAGRGKRKRLGDALEALLGAIYLDAGPAHASRVIRRLLEKYEMLLPRQD